MHNSLKAAYNWKQVVFLYFELLSPRMLIENKLQRIESQVVLEKGLLLNCFLTEFLETRVLVLFLCP